MHFCNLFVTFAFYTEVRSLKKANKLGIDLFNIFGTDDIYFTLDMWAKLSSRPVKKKPVETLTVNIPVTGEVKEQITAIPEKLTGADRMV